MKVKLQSGTSGARKASLPPPLLSADKITYFRANGAVLGPLTNTDIEGVAIPKLCSF